MSLLFCVLLVGCVQSIVNILRLVQRIIPRIDHVLQDVAACSKMLDVTRVRVRRGSATVRRDSLQVQT